MKLVDKILVTTAICAALASSGHAALKITNDDITDNKYTFSLSFDNLATSTKFNDTIFQSNNVSVSSDGSGDNLRRFVRALGSVTTASFIYAFDFSDTDYTPTSLSLYDVTFTQSGTTVKTSYSIDGMASWTTIRTTTGGNTATIDLSSLTGQTVYYKVEFVGPNGGTSNIPNLSAQWARGADGSTPFKTEFTVVSNIPEPSSAILLMGGFSIAAVGMLYAIRKKR